MAAAFAALAVAAALPLAYLPICAVVLDPHRVLDRLRR